MAIALTLVPGSTLGAGEPPSSFAEPEETATIAFEHAGLRARECGGERASCGLSLARARTPGPIRLRATPVPEARFGNRDERQPKAILISGGGWARTTTTAALAPGLWELRGPRSRPLRFRVADGGRASIRVWSVDGWCVKDGDQCRLSKFPWQILRRR